MVKLVDLPLQHQNQKKDIIKSLERILETGDFVLGQAVNEFEEKVADYCGTEYALGLNSGTDALTLALKVYGIREGNEVITVANSFIATAGAIVACGARPVFVDVGEDYLINPEKIEEIITEKTKAIIPVHLTGRIADMNKINKIAEKYNLKVIEDACQAIGAEYDGRKAGNFGDVGCFSLHPLKTLNVLGDGGFVTFNSDFIYEQIKRLRNHGLKNRNEADYFGYNSRLDTFQAMMALKKLDYVNKWIDKKIKISELYQKNLNAEFITLSAKPGINRKDTYTTFIIQADKRDKLQEYLKQNGIYTAIHYPIPIHLQKASQIFGYKEGDLPNTEKQAKKILSLPIHQDLEVEEIEYVCKKIKEFYKK